LKNHDRYEPQSAVFCLALALTLFVEMIELAGLLA
jgi:hypothetical protein